MKKIKHQTEPNPEDNDLLPHYDFDYSKAKPNRFAAVLTEGNGYIKLKPEIMKYFKSSEEVNRALGAIISALPDRLKDQRT